MRHSSINVTVDIHGHLVPDGNRQTVDKLDDLVPEAERKSEWKQRSKQLERRLDYWRVSS